MELDSNYLVAGGTLTLAFVAVFQEFLRSLFWKPNLEIGISLLPPDCYKTILRINETKSDAYYIRIRIYNNGNISAKNVGVMLSSLSRKQADGSYRAVEIFSPMHLNWSYHGIPVIFNLPQKLYMHCDFGHIIIPTERMFFGELNEDLDDDNYEFTIFSLDTTSRLNNRAHLLEKGEYIISISVFAENSSPKMREVKLNLTGEWHDDADRMFQRGIGITIL